MLINVLTKAPKLLTYNVPSPLDKKIKVGQVVLVPLGNKETQGLVWDKNCNKKNYRIKSIIKTITDFPLLSGYQINLIKWIADYYCAPLYKVTSLMMPPRLEGLDHLKKSSKKQIADKPILLWTINQSKKEKIYWQEIKKCTGKGKQAILLYPQISSYHSFINYLISHYGQNVSLLFGKIKIKDLQNEWLSIINNGRKIIIGSQKPLFMPFHNLGLIIIDEEENDLYKQERSPRYQTVKVATKLSELTGAKLILSTNNPSVSSYYQSQKNNYKLIIPKKQLSQKTKNILINLNNLSYENRIISPLLKKEISKYLAEKKQIILFLNRKGMARYISCPDCGYVLNCPSCNLPMVYYQAKNPYLLCHRCHKKESLPETCPKCLSLFIHEKGIGIETIKKILTKFYPLANIKILDREIAQSNIDKIVTDYMSKKIDILIGTQIIINYPELGAELIGIISADSELYLPDFESERKTYFLITSLSKMSKEKTIIQSENPDLPCIKYALANNFLKFYKDDLAKRRLFLHPPFVQIIKVVYSNKDDKNCQQEILKIAKYIKATSSKNILIIGPTPCFITKKRGLYKWQIIIKLLLKNAILSDVQKEFKKKLAGINRPGLSIDVDPKNLIN